MDEKKPAVLADPLTEQEEEEMEKANSFCENGEYERSFKKLNEKKVIFKILLYVFIAGFAVCAIAYAIKAIRTPDNYDKVPLCGYVTVFCVGGAVASIVFSKLIQKQDDKLFELEEQHEKYLYYHRLLGSDNQSENDQTQSQINKDYNFFLLRTLIAVIVVIVVFCITYGLFSSKGNNDQTENTAISVTTSAQSHSDYETTKTTASRSTTSYRHTTHRYTTSYYRRTTTTKSRSDDRYNANDYRNPEDFYYDNEDNFFDYYDAEDYYNDHVD